MRLGIGISLLVACLLVGAPVFGTAYDFFDVNEADPSIDGYDLKRVTIDDNGGAGTDLTIEYETWDSPLLIKDNNAYVNITMWLDIGGFDQDPGENPVLSGVSWDFLIRWFGDDEDVTSPVYDLEYVIYGQDLSVMYTSGANTMTPVGAVLTLDIPWAELVDTSNNLAVVGQTLLPPSFGFFVKHENNHLTQADDIYPDDGEFAQVPEPLTMLGLFMGLGGIGAYIRRRRMA